MKYGITIEDNHTEPETVEFQDTCLSAVLSLFYCLNHHFKKGAVSSRKQPEKLTMLFLFYLSEGFDLAHQEPFRNDNRINLKPGLPKQKL